MTDSTSKQGKIFIGGLSYETTDEKLRSYFAAYGAVTDSVVMKDPVTRRSRGFGFITYTDPACVDRALAQQNHILDSRKVEAKRAVPRAESSREISTSISRGPASNTATSSSNSTNAAYVGATKKIFVGGLHYETKDAEFKKYFQEYGKVVSAEVMFNRETNKSRGFGFVIFESESSVEAVLDEPNHVIDNKSVEVKRAVPRTDVPPRSTSSRADSISGGSGEEASAPNSLSGSGGPNMSSEAPSNRSSAQSSSMATSNMMSNGTISYAAAVLFGSGGAPTSSNSAMTSPTPPNSTSKLIGDSENHHMATSMVTDALNTLGINSRDSHMLNHPFMESAPVSTTSSVSSLSERDAWGTTKTNALSPIIGTSSGLGASSPLSDPIMEQWNLAAPVLSPSSSSDVNAASSPSLSSNGRASAEPLSWHGSPWQQPWATTPQPPLSQPSASKRNAFTSEPLWGSSNTAAWNSSSYLRASSIGSSDGLNDKHHTPGKRFSSMMLGNNLENNLSSSGHSHQSFGSDHVNSSSSSYGGSLSGLFSSNEYLHSRHQQPPHSTGHSFPSPLHSHDPDLPLEKALGGMMRDFVDDSNDRDNMNDSMEHNNHSLGFNMMSPNGQNLSSFRYR